MRFVRFRFPIEFNPPCSVSWFRHKHKASSHFLPSRFSTATPHGNGHVPALQICSWVVNLERPANAVPCCVSANTSKSSRKAVSGESSSEVKEILEVRRRRKTDAHSAG